MLIRILFYLLGPALVFRSIHTSDISISNAVSIGLFVLLLQGIMLASRASSDIYVRLGWRYASLRHVGINVRQLRELRASGFAFRLW